jgi:hypothetical protein
MPGITAPRYAITLDGRGRDDLTTALTGLELRESLEAPAELELTLAAPLAGGPPLLDDATLEVGRALELALVRDDGRAALFLGDVTEVAPRFPVASAATLTLRAVARTRRPPQQAIGAAAPITPQLAYGDALIEASLARSGRTLVTGTALTGGPPTIRPGSAVELVGLGARWSGTYAVTAATHRFGPDGHETAFDVRREVAP